MQGPQSEINKYLIEIQNSDAMPDHDALKFWSGRRESYPRLVRLAQDLMCALASQAFVQRIFFYVWHPHCRAQKPNAEVPRNEGLLANERTLR